LSVVSPCGFFTEQMNIPSTQYIEIKLWNYFYLTFKIIFSNLSFLWKGLWIDLELGERALIITALWNWTQRLYTVL
jgi:hypothetical protein